MDRRRLYDAERGTSRERGYDARWHRASHLFRREHPLCLGCEAVGELKPVEVVDHVEPHRGDMELFWDASKWQPACKWHHDVVKPRLERMFEEGAIPAGELRLDSAAAKALTRKLRRPAAIGLDGWPL